jgi:general secretion pathway protein D
VGSRAASRDSFITDIVRLRSIDAQSALDTVKPLVSPQGSVTANAAGNSLVIVDFADNVHRIRQVLAGIDTDHASTRVIPLKNAGAREIATALKGLVGDGGAQSGQGVQVVSVDSSNSVVLRGDPNVVARLATVAAELDQKAEAGTEIRVVFLENADAAQLLPVLQQLVGEQPSAIPQEDQSVSSNFLSQSSSSSGVSQLQPAVNQAPTPTPTPAANQTTENGAAKPAIVGEGGRTAAVVTRFAGANAIVIAGPPEVQRQLGEVIRQLDTRRQQVLVEAVVAEVSDTAAKELGVQFLLGNLKGGAFAATNYSASAPSLLAIAGAIGARELATKTTTVTDGGTTITGQDTTISNQLAQSAVSSILGTSGGLFGGGGRIGNTILGGIIHAVKSDTQSNLLQSPSVVMLDNTPSHLLVGQEVPITTGRALSDNFDNAFQTIQRENVGIELDVKPQINSSGTIKLFLHQTVSSIAGPVSSDNSELIINKREVQTTMTVDDGQIAVIGGLLDDNERRTLEKIPLLGDIPVLGNLFKSHSKSHAKTNLMIFIRPTILRSAEDTQRVTEQRYGYLRAVQGQMNPEEEPSIDQLVRDYMGAAPPVPPAPLPGNIHDPQIMVPTVRSSTEVIRPAKRKQ